MWRKAALRLDASLETVHPARATTDRRPRR